MNINKKLTKSTNYNSIAMLTIILLCFPPPVPLPPKKLFCSLILDTTRLLCTIEKYSQTCIKRPPVGQTKGCPLRQGDLLKEV